MRANYNLCIRGDKVILVPYRKEHVLIYHEWMKDPALLEATASEPLSLEEEYEMQKSWFEDEKKCTFILLDPDLPDSPNTGCHGGGMIGDVNLYWNDHDEPNTAEIEIMIAEPQSRRKGIASEALNLFMAYAIHNLGVTKFCAKIGDRNKASQQLFARLGYRQESHSDIFKEITMVLDRGKDVESDRSFDVWNRLIDIGKTQLLLDNKKCAYDTMLVPSMAETKK